MAREPARLFSLVPRRGSDSSSISPSCQPTTFMFCCTIHHIHVTYTTTKNSRATKEQNRLTRTQKKQNIKNNAVLGYNQQTFLLSRIPEGDTGVFFLCLEADAGGLEGLGSPAAALGKPSTAVCARHAHARPRRAPGLYPSPPPNPSEQPRVKESATRRGRFFLTTHTPRCSAESLSGGLPPDRSNSC